LLGAWMLASMISTHCDIHRLSRIIDRLSKTAPGNGDEGASMQELRRTL
jgi:hypothetical protein